MWTPATAAIHSAARSIEPLPPCCSALIAWAASHGTESLTSCEPISSTVEASIASRAPRPNNQML